eukprot:jgi/Tetstr1/436340/TSEL_025177.t1
MFRAEEMGLSISTFQRLVLDVASGRMLAAPVAETSQQNREYGRHRNGVTETTPRSTNVWSLGADGRPQQTVRPGTATVEQEHSSGSLI